MVAMFRLTLVGGCLWAALVAPVAAQTINGTYVTGADAVVLECSDNGLRIPNGTCRDLPSSINGREIPFTATVTINASSAEPHLLAVVHDAYWEGAAMQGLQEPFELELESTFTWEIPGGQGFSGTYAMEPWQFDWEFTEGNDETLRLNGAAYWTGGHVWSIFYDDVVLQPIPESSCIGSLILSMALLCRRHSSTQSR